MWETNPRKKSRPWMKTEDEDIGRKFGKLDNQYYWYGVLSDDDRDASGFFGGICLGFRDLRRVIYRARLFVFNDDDFIRSLSKMLEATLSSHTCTRHTVADHPMFTVQIVLPTSGIMWFDYLVILTGRTSFILLDLSVVCYSLTTLLTVSEHVTNTLYH